MDLFGERLKQARTDRGMTQYELAELAGLPRETVGRIERKRNTAYLYTAIVLARALNVSLDWLCGIESPETAQI